MTKVLVYGATGDQGHPLMRQLMEAGFDVTAGMRNPDAFKGTEFENVKTVYASFKETDSLLAASQGMDAIAMNLPFVFDAKLAKLMGDNICEAGAKAGVKKIVFNTSCIVKDHDLDLSAHDGRRAVEKAMEDSGMEYCVIRSVVFMDNITKTWVKPAIINSHVFAYPAAPTLKISWICLEDVAACMVGALKNKDLKAHKLTVGGPQALIGDEVAKHISAAMGETVTFKSLTPDEFASSMSKLVTGSDVVEPHSMYGGMAEFYRFYNEQPTSPLDIDMSETAKLLGVTLTPMSEWAKTIDWTNPN